MVHTPFIVASHNHRLTMNSGIAALSEKACWWILYWDQFKQVGWEFRVTFTSQSANTAGSRMSKEYLFTWLRWNSTPTARRSNRLHDWSNHFVALMNIQQPAGSVLLDEPRRRWSAWKSCARSHTQIYIYGKQTHVRIRRRYLFGFQFRSSKCSSFVLRSQLRCNCSRHYAKLPCTPKISISPARQIRPTDRCVIHMYARYSDIIMRHLKASCTRDRLLTGVDQH